MPDISGDRIKEFLSDPKNLELIAGIAGSMGGMTALSPKEQSYEAPQELNKDADDEKGITAEEKPSFDAMPVFSPSLLMEKAGSDKRIALLKAIKPYINESKRERVDGLVRAISVAGILTSYKDGLFG